MIPKRSNLAAQVVRILRDNLEAETWKDFLPSEAELCQQLQVSRFTLRMALQQLEREGWFQTMQGKRRQIQRTRKNKSCVRPSNRIVLLSPIPLPKASARMMYWVDALRDQLNATGHQLDVRTNRTCYSKQPARALEMLRERLRPAAWVLHLSTRAQQQWFFEQGQPCVLIGWPHTEIQLPFIGRNHAAICHHALQLLARRGCRRMVLIASRTDSTEALEVEHEFLKASEAFGFSKVEAFVAHHDGSVSGLCGVLDRLFKKPESVTGLLISHVTDVATVGGHLIRCKIQIPDEVSLVSLDDDPMLERFVPSIARYRISVMLFARKLVSAVNELVRDGILPLRANQLIPEFVHGETLSVRQQERPDRTQIASG